MVVAFWSQNVTFDSIGDEMSGVFESHFLAFLQGVFPKIISRSVDIPARPGQPDRPRPLDPGDPVQGPGAG